MNPEAADALAALRERFSEQLPQRISAIGQACEDLAHGTWDVEQAQTLHRQVHGLTGSAGTFGMGAVSAAARELEQRLAALLRGPAEPARAHWDAVRSALQRLEQAPRLHGNTQGVVLAQPEARPRGQGPALVYLVEDDAAQAIFLEQGLQEAGYQVQWFDRAEGLRTACAAPGAQIPDAVVMDLELEDGKDEGALLVEELGLGRHAGVPVVMLAVRDDLQARLRALRAGVSRYLVKPADAARVVEVLDGLTGRQPPESYRVLMVDDEPLLLEAQAAVLRAAGMEVHALADPLQVLDAVQAFRPDVIVLDVYMPGASGPELASALRERDSELHLPILFLSSESDLGQQLLALNLGGDDFLVKPVQPVHLVAAVTARARRARQSSSLQRRLQTTLYEREREHLALEQHAIVSMADVSGRITYVNDRFCQVSGYRREELVGQDHRIVKSGEHPPAFYEAMWRTIVSGQAWHGEVCNRRKDGSLYWVESTITPFLDGNGMPYQYVSIRTDITRIKDAEQGIRKQQRFTQDVLDSVSSHVAVLDRNGVIVAVNEPWRRFAEQNAEQAGEPVPNTDIGTNYLAVCFRSKCSLPAEVPAVISGIEGVLLGRMPSFRYEYPCHSPTEDRWFQMMVTPLSGDSGGVVISHTNITERQLAEQKLHRLVWALGERIKEAACLNGVIRLLQDDERSDEAVLQAVVETLPAGWQVPEETCARIRFAGGVYSTPGFKETAWRLAADIMVGVAGEHVVEVFRLRAAEVSEGPAIFLDEEAELLLNIAIQIGQAMGRRNDRRALLAARDEAERANRAKSDFLSSMSHELRTPMNAILGFGQLMEHDETLPAEHQDNVEEIMKAGRHLLELINEVLDLAKVESGQFELSLEAVDLRQVVSECQTLVQPLTVARHIGLEAVAEVWERFEVIADRMRLRQVLLNLLSNAIKYNREGGRVWVQAEARAGARLRLWVHDTGPGISPSRLGELFQPFNRLGAEGSAVEGTGIGLTITKKLVERMGGSIGVESEEGVGSRFWIELPMAYDAAAPVADRPGAAAAPDAAGTASAGTVLYIEDNLVNIKLVSLLLKQQRQGTVRVLTAHTPEMGIELAHAQRPDLILLDINMPGMDGYQVLKVLKADPSLRRIPVVALTANAMQRDIERGRAAGFADYLTKPLEVHRLLQLVDRHLPGAQGRAVYDQNETAAGGDTTAAP